MIPYAKELVKTNQVEAISDTLFKVGSHSVKIQRKPGRTLMICDCQNHTTFCNESPLCSHKIAVIVYMSDLQFNKRITKLIDEYENYLNLKLPVSIETMIQDLKDIKNLR